MEQNSENTAPMEFSFAAIHNSIRALDFEGVSLKPALMRTSHRLRQLAMVYRAVRPFLSAVRGFSVFPALWREALEVLLLTLDEIVKDAPPAADFKAGKDL